MTKGSLLQYLVGGIMIAFSMYQVYLDDLWEFALYATGGAAFISVGLIKDNAFKNHKKLLSVVSWILILLTAFLFFFLVRTDT